MSTAARAEGKPKIALIFTGQGSQYGGMGKHLAANFKAAREAFEEADEALKMSLSKLMFNGIDVRCAQQKCAANKLDSLAFCVCLRMSSSQLRLLSLRLFHFLLLL